MNVVIKFTITFVMLIILDGNYNSQIVAQALEDEFERRVHYIESDSIQYRLFIPNDSTTSTLYPLILTHHPITAMGYDNEQQLLQTRVALTWAEDSAQAKNPTFICSPQVQKIEPLEYQKNIWYPGLESLLDSLIIEFPIDTTRIYVTGLSLGAAITWENIYEYLPDRFAAAIPIAGGWDLEESPLITDIPVWAFCGEDDADETGEMISYIESAGYDVEKKYTVYGDVGLTKDEIDLLNQNEIKHIYTEYFDKGHFYIYDSTYDDPALHYWLFSQKKDTVGGNVKAQVLSVEIFPKYIPLEGDTIKIISEMLNPESNALEVKAYIQGEQSAYSDSLQLYDDGLHGDGAASDNLFADYILLPNLEEDFFDITIRATDLTESRIIISADKEHFTTVGPVDVAGYSLDKEPLPGDSLNIEITLKNNSPIVTVTNIKARISSLDSCSEVIRDIDGYFGNIGPGESRTMLFGYYGIKLNDEILEGTMVPFKVTITSDGYPFWTDTLKIPVIVGIDDEQPNLPKEFALEQNYPNPFNPSTTLKYEIPKESYITLKVYDILGREVETLVNKEQKAGYYEVEFDASNLTSGIYLINIRAEGLSSKKRFTLVKKALLLK